MIMKSIRVRLDVRRRAPVAAEEFPHKESSQVALAGSKGGAGERHPAEQALWQLAIQVAQHAGMLDAVLSASLDVVFVFDHAGRQVYANAAAAQALGLERTDLPGKAGREFGFPPGMLGGVRVGRGVVVADGPALV